VLKTAEEEAKKREAEVATMAQAIVVAIAGPAINPVQVFST
jgi:hypothetical protein